MNKTAEILINKLNLSKHPEGGWFREVYRSEEIIKKNDLPERFNGDRCFSTSIYYLLEGKTFSAFHKIKSDETWHFYFGSSLTLIIIDESSKLNEIQIGNDFENNEYFQYTVLQNCWFAAVLNDQNSFALVGCTVSPGFDFNDYELGEKDILIKQMPQHKSLFEKFCIH